MTVCTLDVLRLFTEIEPAIVGIEACHTTHYWARELMALGHDVRLMPRQFVKPYVKSQKNDAAVAEAICEAVQRPTMRFVPIKSAEQQAALLLHRARDLLIRQRSSLISSILAHFAEFGIVTSRGVRDIDRLLQLLTTEIYEEADAWRRLLEAVTAHVLKREPEVSRELHPQALARVLRWARTRPPELADTRRIRFCVRKSP